MRYISLGPIDQGMVAKGKEIYDVKCQACHSTGTNRVVGPGWKGVDRATQAGMDHEHDAEHRCDAGERPRSSPEMLEECLVRMPNQGLSKEEGREVLEFMRTSEAEKRLLNLTTKPTN
jgi:mono/diheme cytochrome c family protein